ncbi:MAG TPA: PH domain-containing protein [Acidimicrobiales bacterium]|nr:PH domain-containing protein [Acidimicrobiales bacterium]
MNPPWSSEPGDLWLSPSPRLLTMRRVEIGVATLAFGLAVLGPVMSAGGAIPVIVYGSLAALCAAGEVVAGRRYHSWGYCERSRDLLVRRGVLIRRLTVVPYGRMQLVDVTAGAAERAFGLATIKLHTAASSTDARIPGLRPDEATRLRDQLAALGEAQAAGV